MSEERAKPIQLNPGYTDHDAHGYRHGFGPCACAACYEIHRRHPDYGNLTPAAVRIHGSNPIEEQEAT